MPSNPEIAECNTGDQGVGIQDITNSFMALIFADSFEMPQVFELLRSF
jgi:hypothetical protein